MNRLTLWFLRRFQYVRQLESRSCEPIPDIPRLNAEQIAAGEAKKPRAFKLRLGWREIADRKAAKLNKREQRIQKLAKELENQ